MNIRDELMKNKSLIMKNESKNKNQSKLIAQKPKNVCLQVIQYF